MSQRDWRIVAAGVLSGASSSRAAVLLIEGQPWLAGALFLASVAAWTATVHLVWRVQ